MAQKLAALTFDDGHSNVTPLILDVLEENNAIGTFFLVGNNVTEETKPLLKRQMDMGCEVANHSLTHSSMMNFSAEGVRAEIEATTEKIIAMGGNEPKFFRPPYGDLSDTMFENIDLSFIFGIDSRDWMAESTVEDRVNNVMAQIKDGAIILMHDFSDNFRTVEALPRIISNLRSQGYEFVTVSKLFEAKGINPNVKGKVWDIVE